MSDPFRDPTSEEPATAPEECLSGGGSVEECVPQSNRAGLTRHFSPSELDLADLAEAVRCLLRPPSRPDPDLLSETR